MNSETEEVQDEGVNKSMNNIPPHKHNSSFPYTGIFSPGGFLATVSNVENDLEGSFSCPAATVTINSTVSHTAHQELGLKSGLEVELTEQREGEGEPGPGFELNPDFLPSSEHALFAVDLVLEKIMRSLETRELLTCRRVCHRWLSFASLQLQKSPSLKICFVDNILSHTRTTETTFNTFSVPDFQLDLLTDLVRPYSENCLSGFPCSKFDFYSETVDSDVTCRGFQNFLNVYGVHIRELSIECKPPQFENNLIQFIRKLLLEQAPNLRCLSLYLTTVTEANSNSTADKVNDCQSLKFKHENNHSNSSVNNYTNASLKVLQMGCVPSSAILEMVLTLVPNLDEMILDKYNYKYFTEPFSRAHLLKKLHFDPDNSVAIDALQKIALAVCSLTMNNSDGSESSDKFNLKLREIYIYNWGKFQKKDTSAELRNKCVFTINRFFESSWDTLETIEWSGVSFFNGMLWPKIMPNVRKVDLGTSRHTETNIFPPGFSLATTFPKLQTVYLYDHDGGGKKFVKFLNSLSYDKKAVFTVKNVYVSNSVSERSTMEVLNLVKELFPCAHIHDDI